MTTSHPTAQPSPQTRIITHMNTDHHDSLTRYLEHHSHLPSRTARHARLTSITLTSLTISTSSKDSYRIPFDPPLGSFADARSRLVELDTEARTALGRDEVTLRRYEKPRLLHLCFLGGFLFTLALLGRGRSALLPETNDITTPLKERFPGFFSWLWKVQPWVLWPMVGAHVAETVALDRVLRRHSVCRGSWVWWCWVVSCMGEGFGSLQRVRGIVGEEKRRREGKRH